VPAPAAPFDRIRITATAGAGDVAAVVSLRHE
jgi:hypothetical protein